MVSVFSISDVSTSHWHLLWKTTAWFREKWELIPTWYILMYLCVRQCILFNLVFSCSVDPTLSLVQLWYKSVYDLCESLWLLMELCPYIQRLISEFFCLLCPKPIRLNMTVMSKFRRKMFQKGRFTWKNNALWKESFSAQKRGRKSTATLGQTEITTFILLKV